jgi:transporter family protein
LYAARRKTAFQNEQSPLLATIQSSNSLRQLKSHHAAGIIIDYKTATLPMDAASIATHAPPLLIWIGPALICALFYALYNICIKKGSNTIHPVLGGVILQFVAALLGSVLLGVLVLQQGGYQDMPCDSSGVFWAVGAGAAVGAAEILSFIVSGMGVQAMQSIPIIIGGSVLFGTTLGYTLLHESLSGRGWSGVVLIALGITLVGIDPGTLEGWNNRG